MAAPNPHKKKLLDALPETLAEMARVIPPAAVLDIAERFGGTRLYFAREPNEQCELAQLVGLAAARTLGKHYGGELFEVPRASAARRALRNGEICDMAARGCTRKRDRAQAPSYRAPGEADSGRSPQPTSQASERSRSVKQPTTKDTTISQQRLQAVLDHQAAIAAAQALIEKAEEALARHDRGVDELALAPAGRSCA